MSWLEFSGAALALEVDQQGALGIRPAAAARRDSARLGNASAALLALRRRRGPFRASEQLASFPSSSLAGLVHPLAGGLATMPFEVCHRLLRQALPRGGAREGLARSPRARGKLNWCVRGRFRPSRSPSLRPPPLPQISGSVRNSLPSRSPRPSTDGVKVRSARDRHSGGYPRRPSRTGSGRWRAFGDSPRWRSARRPRRPRWRGQAVPRRREAPAAWYQLSRAPDRVGRGAC